MSNPIPLERSSLQNLIEILSFLAERLSTEGVQPVGRNTYDDWECVKSLMYYSCLIGARNDELFVRFTRAVDRDQDMVLKLGFSYPSGWRGVGVWCLIEDYDASLLLRDILVDNSFNVSLSFDGDISIGARDFGLIKAISIDYVQLA